MRLLQNTLTRPVVGVGFGPDGRTLVAGGSGGFDVWDLAAGSRIFVRAQKLSRYSTSTFVMDPLGRWLYVSGLPDGCYLYDLPSGEPRRFPSANHVVLSVGAAADGSRVALNRVGSGHHRLECWSIAADGGLSLAWTVSCPVPYVPFWGLAFHPRGEALAGIEQRHFEERRRRPTRRQAAPYRIVLRKASSGEQLSEFGSIAHSFLMRTIFAPDGERLLCWAERQFTVWDAATGTHLGWIPAPGRANFTDLAVHPSGRFAVTAAGDGHARYWDFRELKQTRAFRWQIGKLYSVAFSRDGMLAAAGGDKGQVVVWDVDC